MRDECQRVISLCTQMRRFFVTHSPMQHALREVREIFSRPIAQMILCAVVLLLAVSGPFGTLDAIPFGPRLAYWAITVPLTFAVGVIASAFIFALLKGQNSPWPARVAAPLATAIMVGLTVSMINWLAFGVPLQPMHMGPVVLTAAVIAFVFQHISSQPTHVQINTSEPPAILQRLDLHKRGELISMSVQDHYVEVTTTKGASLILMRLGDAMRETGDIEGLQIHRSHWAATQHIVKAERNGDKALLTLSDARVLPASRSRIKDLKDAGILPL